MSDTHLSLSCDKPMEVFGSRWKNYHERIAANWLERVGQSDTVIVTGDVSWGMTLQQSLADFRFLDALPGKKLLGKGNHDYWWDTVKKMTAFFDANGITTMKFLYNNSYLVDGIAVAGSRGWFNDEKAAPDDSDYAKLVAREAIRTEASLSDAVKKFGVTPTAFLHFPPVYKSCICGEIIAVLKKYNVRRCYYGHIHGVYDLPPAFDYEGISFIITSADYLGFVPLPVQV